MSRRWNGRELVEVAPEPVDPRMPAAVRPSSDPFGRTRTQNRELGKRAIEMSDAEQAPQEPSSRSAFANGSSERARLLNGAAQHMLRLGQASDASDLSLLLAQRRSEVNESNVDTSDPTLNAELFTELAEDIESDAQEIAEGRELQQMFDRFTVEAVGGGDPQRTNELLAELDDEHYQELVDVLNEAFIAELEHGEYGSDVEPADYDEADEGEPIVGGDFAGDGFEGGDE